MPSQSSLHEWRSVATINRQLAQKMRLVIFVIIIFQSHSCEGNGIFHVNVAGLFWAITGSLTRFDCIAGSVTPAVNSTTSGSLTCSGWRASRVRKLNRI